MELGILMAVITDPIHFNPDYTRIRFVFLREFHISNLDYEIILVLLERPLQQGLHPDLLQILL